MHQRLGDVYRLYVMTWNPSCWRGTGHNTSIIYTSSAGNFSRTIEKRAQNVLRFNKHIWQQMSAPLGLDGLLPETHNTSSRRFNNGDIVETLEWRLETIMEKAGKRVTVTCDLSSDPLRGSQCLVYVIGMLFLPLKQNSVLSISFDAHSHHSSVSRWPRLAFVSWKDLLARYRGRLTKMTLMIIMRPRHVFGRLSFQNRWGQEYQTSARNVSSSILDSMNLLQTSR